MGKGKHAATGPARVPGFGDKFGRRCTAKHDHNQLQFRLLSWAKILTSPQRLILLIPRAARLFYFQAATHGPLRRRRLAGFHPQANKPLALLALYADQLKPRYQ